MARVEYEEFSTETTQCTTAVAILRLTNLPSRHPRLSLSRSRLHFSRISWPRARYLMLSDICEEWKAEYMQLSMIYAYTSKSNRSGQKSLPLFVWSSSIRYQLHSSSTHMLRRCRCFSTIDKEPRRKCFVVHAEMRPFDVQVGVIRWSQEYRATGAIFLESSNVKGYCQYTFRMVAADSTEAPLDFTKRRAPGRTYPFSLFWMTAIFGVQWRCFRWWNTSIIRTACSTTIVLRKMEEIGLWKGRNSQRSMHCVRSSR